MLMILIAMRRMAENAREELSRQIRRVHEAGYQPNNPILEAIGIINLERSNDPNEKLLGQLLSSVETLSGEVRDIQQHLQFDALRRTSFNALDLYGRNNDLFAPPAAAYGLTPGALSLSNNPSLMVDALLRRSGNATVDAPPPSSRTTTPRSST
jgi:hypothetical protein